jgi:CspA family cold shock protein
MNIQKGIVKEFDIIHNQGIITPNDGSKEIFVCGNVVKAANFGSIYQGQPIRYKIQDLEGKLSAVNLKVDFVANDNQI